MNDAVSGMASCGAHVNQPGKVLSYTVGKFLGRMTADLHLLNPHNRRIGSELSKCGHALFAHPSLLSNALPPIDPSPEPYSKKVR